MWLCQLSFHWQGLTLFANEKAYMLCLCTVCCVFKICKISFLCLLLQMLILLYSDTNYVLDGFQAEFFVTNCPNNCSDHGMCSPLHKCYCEGTWGGQDCGLDLCPEGCGKDLHRGECKMNRCRCEPGYSGQACSLYSHDQSGNKWVMLYFSYLKNGSTVKP